MVSDENVVIRHAAMISTAYFGVGKSIVEPPRNTNPDASGTVAWTRDHVTNCKVPRHIEFLPALLRNADGKLLQAKLRERE